MFTLYSADITGNPGNCSYPHKHDVVDEASLKTAICHDYVCAEYKNNYRNGDNFIGSDCLPVDCDNDHSEEPADWITPDDVAAAFPGVSFAVHYSRFHNREKNGKPARPKFHILFPIDFMTDAAAYSDMKKLVNTIFPYFDTQALDAARFFFGTTTADVEIREGSIATLGDNGAATYNFMVSTAGTYDIAVRICYPFWDKNGIYVSIDGATTHYTESRLWWPYWRSTFWTTLASGISLSAGSHTIRISVDVKGVQFYGFRICDSFSEAPSAGDATYTLSPRQFKDVNGNMVGPDRGFKLTLEMLRRKPDSALVWYEDFRDYGVLATNYWTTLSGEWEVWRSEEYSTERVYTDFALGKCRAKRNPDQTDGTGLH